MVAADDGVFAGGEPTTPSAALLGFGYGTDQPFSDPVVHDKPVRMDAAWMRCHG